MRPGRTASHTHTSMGVETMSSTRVAPQVGLAPDRGAVPRVRHQAREAATVMAFSAATSVGLAMLLLLLAALLQQG